MSELSAKAQEGDLSKQEKEDLDEYLRAADLLAVLQSRARRSLLNKNKA